MTILPGNGSDSKSPKLPSRGIAGVAALVVLIAGAGLAYRATRSTDPAASNAVQSVASAPAAPAVATTTPSAPATPHGAPGRSGIPAPPSATTAPSQPVLALLAARSRQAALEAGSVHLDVDDEGDGPSQTFSDDAGPTSGIQRISVDGEPATVIVVGGTTYFTADSSVLASYFGLDTADAAALGGRWMSLAKGDPDYEQFTEGVTLSSALAEDPIAGPFTELPVQVRDGVRVIGIQGVPGVTGATPGATVTLWIPASGTPLPVEYDYSAIDGTSVARMSKWGKAVSVVPPKGALALPGSAAGAAPAGAAD